MKISDIRVLSVLTGFQAQVARQIRGANYSRPFHAVQVSWYVFEHGEASDRIISYFMSVSGPVAHNQIHHIHNLTPLVTNTCFELLL